MKLKGLLVGALALGLGAAACGSDEADTSEFGLVEAGTLTVCTDTPFPPMEFEDPDAPTGFSGFDIELMEAIAADLGLEVKVDVPGWEAITSGLAMEAGNCDISASSITITKSVRRTLTSPTRTSRLISRCWSTKADRRRLMT